jgi:tetratricopeptide (TPR) repeat protein
MKVEACPQCGATADPKAQRCLYCKSPFAVVSIKSLAGKDTSKYMRFFRGNLLKDANDFESLFSLALCYLQLRRFRDAAAILERAKDLAPTEPGIYLYLAIAVVGNRRPRNMSKPEVAKVEESLDTARSLDADMAAADILLAFVKYDFYVINGLRFSGDKPEDLLADCLATKRIDPEYFEFLGELYGGCVDNPIAASFKLTPH